MTTLRFDQPVTVSEGTWFEMRRSRRLPYTSDIPHSEEYILHIGDVAITVQAAWFENRVSVVSIEKLLEGPRTTWPTDLSALLPEPAQREKKRKVKRAKKRTQRKKSR